MIANLHSAQSFRACTDINMATNLGDTSAYMPTADGHLLKNKAIWPDQRAMMDDHSAGMREQEPSPDPGIDGNITTRDGAPEPVAQNRNFLGEHENGLREPGCR